MQPISSYITGLKERMEAGRQQAALRRQELRQHVDRLAGICRRHGATEVWLFGSLATDRDGGDPDIDLAVRGLPARRFFDCYGELLMAAPAPVDLVDLETCPPHLREAVLREGVRQ